jgi:hypothetical protein
MARLAEKSVAGVSVGSGAGGEIQAMVRKTVAARLNKARMGKMYCPVFFMEYLFLS